MQVRFRCRLCWSGFVGEVQGAIAVAKGNRQTTPHHIYIIYYIYTYIYIYSGVLWYGVVWCGLVGVVWFGWCGLVGVEWFGWCGVVWGGLVGWCGVVLCSFLYDFV